MDTIDFNKNDFPLTTNVLGFLQTAAQLIEKLAGIISGNYIISGCETVGASTSGGYVVVNGEIMPFAGGTTQTYVRVVSTTETITVNDGTYTKTTKQLVFGAGTGQIAWSTFKNARDLIENQTFSLPQLSGSAGLTRAVVEIGDWNMDTEALKSVSLPMAISGIRSVSIIIRFDSSQYMIYRDLLQDGYFEIQWNGIIVLHRNESGVFDSDAYDNTSYNRGWIVIDYVA
ncbi:MAG: hypothetical protein JXB49_26060 [Bacteroidales bacterium]|nr:hypothetical protein [Bacteroidales bacterium]